jgi:SAM-dependent methyltransferase/predicted transcriptional regulator
MTKVQKIDGIECIYVPLDNEVEHDFNSFLASGMMDLIESFAVVETFYNFIESEMFEILQRHHEICLPQVFKNSSINQRNAKGMLEFLSEHGYFFWESQTETYTLTPKGKASLNRVSLGFLRMFRGGYGDIYKKSGELVSGKIKYGKDIVRYGKEVSLGSNLITNNILDQVADYIIKNEDLKVVADLGCGAGYFLVHIAKRNSKLHLIGIDNTEDAIRTARSYACDNGVEKNIEFIVGDCFDLSLVKKECQKIDLFYSFALEHELLFQGEGAVIDRLQKLASQFPGKRYLIGEPLPFTSAFKWYHCLTNQGIPRKVEDWVRILKKVPNAKLKSVYIPEHRYAGAFYDFWFDP